MSVAAVADPAAAPALGPQAAVARIAELRQLIDAGRLRRWDDRRERRGELL